jgi:6-phosphogluconolactonase
MNLVRIQKSNAQDLATILAEDVATNLRNAIEISDEARLAVSGGSTPIVFLEQLSGQDLDWSKVKITLVDDRCVPADHPDSNAKLVREHLLNNAATEAQFSPLYFGESVLEQLDEASLFEAESTLQRNFPNYHAVVLGMGADAHTASIFPQAAERELALDLDQARACVMTHPVTANYWRITQTRQQLLKTDLLALHIVGAEKIALFDAVAAASSDGPRAEFPISYFMQQTELPLTVYCSE